MTQLETKEALETQFVEAIRGQRLAQSARAALASPDVSGAARSFALEAEAACRAISEEITSLEREVAGALAAQGVDAEVCGSRAERGEMQFHFAHLRVAAKDLDAALKVCAELGFEAPFEMTAGRSAGLRLFAAGLQLVRFDAVTMRLYLEIAGRGGGFGTLRGADFAFADLPAGLAWAYPGIKLARLFSERVMGRAPMRGETDFLGTPRALILPILKRLGIGAEDTLIDLGCGDGRVLVVAAEAFGARAIGIEMDPELAALARKRAAGSPAARLIEVQEGDALSADLGAAQLVFMFLPRALASRAIGPALERMGPGARLVVHEQARIDAERAPDLCFPVITDAGITVVHVFEAGQ